MRLDAFLRASAARHPEKTALVAGDTRLSYAAFDDACDRLARALVAAGLRPGERVLVFMDNCWEAAVAIYAVSRAGGVFSPINPSTKADKLAYIIANCRARAVITLDRLAKVAGEALAASPGPDIAIIAGPRADAAIAEAIPEGVRAQNFTQALDAGAGADTPHPDLADSDLAMLIYTSGSTGRPKGVMMAHGNIDAASASITTYLRNTPDDIILNVLPIAFDYGLYQLIMSVRMGATLILEKSFAFPQAIFELMRRERVTGLPLVPTMAAMILQMKSLEPGFLPDLRYVTNTAAALPPSHIAGLRALLPGVALFSMYGLTECKRCTWLPPENLDAKPGSVGIAIPGTQAFVVDDEGNPLPAGSVGELAIAGPHVMLGYWDNPEASAAALRPGPKPGERILMTGDLFRADEDGYLYFVGRKDDIIKSRGEKVPPKEVEAVLHACPGVAEAVVFGTPDPVLGQAVTALVVRADPALKERDVIRHCARNLEDFMVPKSIVFSSTLPRTDTGKISRRLAAAMLDTDIADKPLEAAE
ncbi:MAG: acyl--CoA ligase [Salinarimonas sp.]|nr:acyl--CoA ligase [Salinarimonas sp.]